MAAGGPYKAKDSGATEKHEGFDKYGSGSRRQIDTDVI